jgi:hypothetical protein
VTSTMKPSHTTLRVSCELEPCVQSSIRDSLTSSRWLPRLQNRARNRLAVPLDLRLIGAPRSDDLVGTEEVQVGGYSYSPLKVIRPQQMRKIVVA